MASKYELNWQVSTDPNRRREVGRVEAGASLAVPPKFCDRQNKMASDAAESLDHLARGFSSTFPNDEHYGTDKPDYRFDNGRVYLTIEPRLNSVRVTLNPRLSGFEDRNGTWEVDSEKAHPQPRPWIHRNAKNLAEALEIIKDVRSGLTRHS